jgi:predicted PurR-regulated permease PerM
MKRQHVLASVALFFGLLATVTLFDVFGTVFFALTVAYVFTPVYNWFTDRGLPRWWASAATTVVAFASAIGLFLPIFVILYLRRGQLVDLIERIPDEFAVDVFGFEAAITLAEAQRLGLQFLSDLAVQVARAAPILLVKFGLFAIVLFALFLGQRRVKLAALSVVPADYHDVVAALVDRAQSTLYAIYVLQALTGLATFLVALPVFYLLGYTNAPFALALVAGLLQFAPIIGPSLLVGTIALFELAVGNVLQATLVAVLAGILIAWLPDLVIRPRFARETADLPGSLYFIGFTGGVFGFGAIGIIAGPLVVALLAESIELLSTELNGDTDSPLAEQLDFDLDENGPEPGSRDVSDLIDDPEGDENGETGGGTGGAGGGGAGGGAGGGG